MAQLQKPLGHAHVYRLHNCQTQSTQDPNATTGGD